MRLGRIHFQGRWEGETRDLSGAVIAYVGNVEVPLRVKGETGWEAQRGFPGRATIPLVSIRPVTRHGGGQAAGSDAADTVIFSIRHVESAGPVGHHGGNRAGI